MSRSQKRKSESRAIQRVRPSLPSATIETPDGPAVVQVIDVPSSELGPVAPANGQAGPRGINILSAVLRRWWLVLVVAVIVGGSGVLIANRLVKPVYQTRALVLYHPIMPMRALAGATATDPTEVVRTHIELLTKPEIALRAARKEELQRALPWLKEADLESPAVQKAVGIQLRGICEAYMVPNTELVEIYTEKPDGFLAAAIVNAFADAFVEHCSGLIEGKDAVRRRKLEEQVAQQDAMLKALIQKKNELMVDNDFETRTQQKATVIAQINEYIKAKNEAEIERLAREKDLERFIDNVNDARALAAQHQLERRNMIEQEKAKDALLQAALVYQYEAYNRYMQHVAEGKKDAHRDVKIARDQLTLAQQKVEEREAEIAAAIDASVAEVQKLQMSSNLDQARARLKEAEQKVAIYEKRLGEMDQEAHRLAVEQQKIEQLDREIARVDRLYGELSDNLYGIAVEQQTQGDAIILVADRAEVPPKPTDDKRVKVQAASLIGGLFVGIFLALLADKFDRRLRHPRDIEPLLGAPMLGMIPKIQELKRAKGEQARNLIAEEFRLIRTQLLFGTPDLQHRSICITSPGPGDGKTSLAVNLAISLAKAGRRVLLVDADLRKPDIHRIFKIPERPGLVEVLERSAELVAAIRKTETDMLELLPAGVSTGRPCELLSRQEMRALTEGLSGMYDHIIFDSAPLLPVSDTHVLLGMVDGVICSFNAEVDTDTVKMMEEILKRGGANVIGSVINQVKYRQSTSYQRGKSAYSSYYSAPRQDAAPLVPAGPQAVATLGSGKASA